MRIHAFIKEIHGNIENARHLEQAAGADAIDAFLVFLDLLEGQAQEIAQPLLAHADQHAPDTHTVADLHIYWIGLLLWHALLELFAARKLALSAAQRKQLISDAQQVLNAGSTLDWQTRR